MSIVNTCVTPRDTTLSCTPFHLVVDTTADKLLVTWSPLSFVTRKRSDVSFVTEVKESV